MLRAVRKALQWVEKMLRAVRKGLQRVEEMLWLFRKALRWRRRCFARSESVNSAQEVVQLENNIGQCGDGQRVTATKRKAGLVAVAHGLSKYQNLVVLEILDPDFRLQFGVDRQLHLPIKPQR